MKKNILFFILILAFLVSACTTEQRGQEQNENTENAGESTEESYRKQISRKRNFYGYYKMDASCLSFYPLKEAVTLKTGYGACIEHIKSEYELQIREIYYKVYNWNQKKEESKLVIHDNTGEYVRTFGLEEYDEVDVPYPEAGGEVDIVYYEDVPICFDDISDGTGGSIVYEHTMVLEYEDKEYSRYVMDITLYYYKDDLGVGLSFESERDAKNMYDEYYFYLRNNTNP